MLSFFYIFILINLFNYSINDNLKSNKLQHSIDINVNNVSLIKSTDYISYNGFISFNKWQSCTSDVINNDLLLSISFNENYIDKNNLKSEIIYEIDCNNTYINGIYYNSSMNLFSVAIFNNQTMENICYTVRNINNSNILTTCGDNSDKNKPELIVIIIVCSIISSIIIFALIGYCIIKYKHKEPELTIDDYNLLN